VYEMKVLRSARSRVHTQHHQPTVVMDGRVIFLPLHQLENVPMGEAEVL
jgi:hypothetical protein